MGVSPGWKRPSAVVVARDRLSEHTHDDHAGLRTSQQRRLDEI